MRPSIIKIVTNDYVAFMSVLIPVIAWIGILVLVFIQSNALLNLALVAGVVTVVSLIALGWRLSVFYAVFRDGLSVPGVVSGVTFFRDRGRVEYVYSHAGEKLLSGNAVHKTGQTAALHVGQEVVVVLDRNNPKRAYLRDLYV